MNKKSILLYCCGPTTYEDIHIGNLRSFYNASITRNIYRKLSVDLSFAMNFTDIDDKIIKKSESEKLNFFVCSNKYKNICIDSLNKFSILKEGDLLFSIIDFMPLIIKDVEYLLKNQFAYSKDDGIYCKLKNILFDYPILTNRKLSSEKIEDFALWKFYHEDPFWNTSFGKGRPGWHIECASVISYLLSEHIGKELFLFGGEDLIFPHHENQVLLLKLLGKKFELKHFVTKPLVFQNKKMSKSIGNIIYFNDIDKGYFNALRMYYLNNNFDKRLKFSFDILEGFKVKFNSLMKKLNKFNHEINDISEYNRIFDNALNGLHAKNIAYFFSENVKLSKQTLLTFLSDIYDIK